MTEPLSRAQWLALFAAADQPGKALPMLRASTYQALQRRDLVEPRKAGGWQLTDAGWNLIERVQAEVRA